MRAVLIPGYRGSGADHWQSLWESDEPGFSRIEPASWTGPGLEDWIGALDRAISEHPVPPLLIAHSLGCLLVAHWAARAKPRNVAGAFLVAVPDPDLPIFPKEAADFARPPWKPFPFPTLVVASDDDPFASPDHAARVANECGARLAAIGARGHVNALSGLGGWEEGRALLDAFCADLGGTPGF